MGQDISTAINQPPLTLHHCFVDGHIDLSRYYYYKRRCDNHNKSINIGRRNAFKKRKRMHIDSSTSKKKRKIGQ